MDSQSQPPRLFPLPSRSYKEARESGVYRLSELMFGSLLAAYILGFVGAVATVRSPYGDLPPLGHALRAWLFTSGESAPPLLYAIDFILISIAFSYVTASLYINYHAGILTMPHLPIERLRWDFVVALSQAICFGLSILHPLAFVFSVGLILLLSLVRQWYECGKLAAVLAEVIARRASSESAPVVEREQTSTSENYVQEIKQEIKNSLYKKRGDSGDEKRRKEEMLPLQLWAGPRLRSWAFAGVLFVIGSIGILLHMTPASQVMFDVYLAFHFFVAVAIVLGAHRTLKIRGPLLVHSTSTEGTDIMTRMDKAAEPLSARIQRRVLQ